ncbi:MAG: crotonase/enoyl-CoA hydratase family protein [Myxococcota bacterium]|nr:crotonase/enoyl-CoA hydratase family protein [Myxococcota bacterium]
MEYKCFDVSVDDQVAHIVLSRPEKRNSMVPEFWDELPEIVREIDEKSMARAIVISSTGPHFSAGLDLQAFAPSENLGGLTGDSAEKSKRQSGARFYNNVMHMQRSFSCLEESRIPVLAAIQGGCIGGGVDLVTACDMRYATEDAFLTIFEINVGMTADVGTFPRIVKLLPEGVVRELAYTGRRISAAEAQSLGLVNRVYADHASLLEGVLELAREIASKPPLAIYGCKRMITYARDHTTADGLDYISIWNASMLQPAEMAESIQARAEKRDGNFADLPPIHRKLARD